MQRDTNRVSGTDNEMEIFFSPIEHTPLLDIGLLHNPVDYYYSKAISKPPEASSGQRISIAPHSTNIHAYQQRHGHTCTISVPIQKLVIVAPETLVATNTKLIIKEMDNPGCCCLIYSSRRKHPKISKTASR